MTAPFRFGARVAALVLASSIATANDSVEQMTVIGHRPPSTLDVSTDAGTEYAIGRLDFENANARSLDEILEFVPGLNVRVGGDGTPRIDMRGLRTRQVKVLVNGVPMNSVGDGTFDPTLIPSEYIDAVQILPGAGSQLYGDGALAGALNVITRRGEGPPRADVRLEFGDRGAQRLAGTYSQGFERGDLFVSIGRRHRDGWALSGDFEQADTEDGGSRLNSDLTRHALYAIANYRPSDAWELGVTLNYYEGSRGIPTSIYDDRDDIFARRPRYERANAQDGWYLQGGARYDDGGAFTNHAWIYATNDTTVTDRYEDARFAPTTDPAVRNTFTDTTRGRIVGGQNLASFDAGAVGRFSASIAVRRETLVSDCVIQDLPVADTSKTGTSGADASSYILDYTLTTTNDHGATDATGGSAPVARLVASNRPGGGIDFELTNLTGTTFGPDTYLKHLFLSPGPGFDLASLSWAQATGSEGDIGNVNIRAENVDGYEYSLRVNFKRPEQGDALYDGEVGRWLFDQGDVNDFFAVPVAGTPGSPDVYGAARFRRVDAAGFWGPSEVLGSGGTPEDAYNVNVQALGATPDATPGVGLVADPDIGAPIVDIRLCSGGGGGGGGLGLGGNRVERVPALTFEKRRLTQDRAMNVVSTALEYAVEPLDRLAVVASLGYHTSMREASDADAAFGYSLAGYFDLRADLRLRATAAHKVRVPSIVQLYDPDRGNPDLTFESADGIEAGLDYTPDPFRFALTWFRQDVEDFIQTDPITERFANVEALRFSGVEWLGEWRAPGGTSVRSGYSFLTSEDRSPGTLRDAQQYTPRHRMTLAADHAVSSRLRLHVQAEYTAGQVHYARTVLVRERALPDYLVVDANVAFSLPGGRAELYIGADNLFDANYAEAYGLPQPGRFVYAGLKARLF